MGRRFEPFRAHQFHPLCALPPCEIYFRRAWFASAVSGIGVVCQAHVIALSLRKDCKRLEDEVAKSFLAALVQPVDVGIRIHACGVAGAGFAILPGLPEGQPKAPFTKSLRRRQLPDARVQNAGRKFGARR